MSEFFLRTGATDTPSVARVDANGMQYVKPALGSGGFIATNTVSGGTGWGAFGAQALTQLTIGNDTGTDIEIRQDNTGLALTVFDGTYYTIFGITDASQISVRRKDQSTTQVAVKARWEA